MGQLYTTMSTIHNVIGVLTLILTVAAAGVLLLPSLTTAGNGTMVLRVTFGSAMIQALLGLLMIVAGLAAYGTGYITVFWLHYVLGTIAIVLIAMMIARAQSVPNMQARRYGALILVLLFVVGAYYVGSARYVLPLG
jgi:hypothetical protein